jgi:hypothetical protein
MPVLPRNTSQPYRVWAVSVELQKLSTSAEVRSTMRYALSRVTNVGSLAPSNGLGNASCFSSHGGMVVECRAANCPEGYVLAFLESDAHFTV